MAPIIVQGKPLATVKNDDADLAIEGDSDENSEYVHHPLPGPDFIRVLELLPGAEKSDLQCSINPLCLDDTEQYPYRAISYTWQDSEYDNLLISGARVDFPGPRERYSIRHPLWCNGCRILISTNLRDALRRFRHPSLGVRLWIDAVCINQDDLEERAQQVVLMPRIYHGAVNVWFWLGESDGNSIVALQWIREINNLTAHMGGDHEASARPLRLDVKDSVALQSIGLLSIDSPQWKALIHLFQRPVFQRIWIIQELVTGREVIIRCGDTILNYEEIDSAVDFITRHHWDAELSNYYFKGNNFFQFNETIKEIKMEWCLNRYNIRPRLVLATRNFQSTDPRDKVYALMGLFNGFAHREADQLHHGDNYQRPFDVLAQEFDTVTINRPTEGNYYTFATAITRAMKELIIHEAEIERRRNEEQDAQAFRESTDEHVANLRVRLEFYLRNTIPAVIESTRQDRLDDAQNDESQAVKPLMSSFPEFDPLSSYSMEENMDALLEGINSLEAKNDIHGFIQHIVTSVNTGVWRVQHLQGIGDAAENYLSEIKSLENMLLYFLRLLGLNLGPLTPPTPPSQLTENGYLNTGSDHRDSEPEYSPTDADTEHGVRFCEISHVHRTAYDPGEFCCSHVHGHYSISCSSYDENYFNAALDSVALSTLPPSSGCLFSENSWHLLKALFGDLSDWVRGPKFVSKGSIDLGEDGEPLNSDPNHWAQLDKKWLGDNFVIPDETPLPERVNIAPPQHWSWSLSISRMPDYRLTVQEIYREFTVRSLMDDPGLFILSTIEDTSLRSFANLPSWVPDFSTPLACNLLVFPELDVCIPYSAGGNSTPQITLSNENPEVLCLQTHQFDSVEIVTDANLSSNVSSVIQQATELCRNQKTESYPTGEDKTDALWRTLVANCSIEPDYEYPAPQSLSEYFKELQVDGLENLNVSDVGEKRDEITQRNAGRIFLNSAKRVLKQRVFFITKKGYFGVGPISTKPEDKVILFNGGSLPFVTRSQSDPSSETTEPQRNLIIGECYCHGICEGQALDSAGFEWEKLVLV